MATAPHPAIDAPARPLQADSDLAIELAEAYHLMAQCLARRIPIPDSLLNSVDRLLDRVEWAQLYREKIA